MAHMRLNQEAILSCLRVARVALCGAIITVIATVSAQGQYRLVQGKIVPRNSPDWTVIYDKIEVKGFVGGALLCTTYAEKEVNATTTVASAHKPQVVPTTTSIKVYKDTFVWVFSETSG